MKVELPERTKISARPRILIKVTFLKNFALEVLVSILMGHMLYWIAQWLSGRVLDSRSKGYEFVSIPDICLLSYFEPHMRRYVDFLCD